MIGFIPTTRRKRERNDISASIINTIFLTMALRKGFVFLGAAGVGKGTFAGIICRRKGWDHFSTGDILRQEIKNGTELGKAVKETIMKGHLVSDDVTNRLVEKALKSGTSSFVLDGYPRSIYQATFLQTLVQSSSIDLQVAHITLREDVVIRKLLGRRICKSCGGNFNVEDVMEEGFDMPAIPPIPSQCKLGESKCNPILLPRDDDTEDAIRKRLSDYHQNIGPLLEFYGNLGNLKDFNVKKGVKDTDELLELLEKPKSK